MKLTIALLSVMAVLGGCGKKGDPVSQTPEIKDQVYPKP